MPFSVKFALIFPIEVSAKPTVSSMLPMGSFWFASKNELDDLYFLI